MPNRQGKRNPHIHGVPRDVLTLDDADDLSQEQVAVDGIPVSVPASFGSDGMEHRFGTPCVCPGGNVSLFQC